MNYSIFIAKLLKKAEQGFFEDGTPVSEVLVEFYEGNQPFSPEKLQISLWGELSQDIIEHYSVNDYIIIEGYLSYGENNIDNTSNDMQNQLELTVVKLYPFLLKHQILKKNKFPF